jgi:hypothetical protein
MAINQGGIKVTIQSKSTGLSQPVTLKSSARTINALKDIADVVETSPQTGHTLVYNAATDKYEVKQLSIADIGVDEIDGGTF